jgi:UDP-N-acetylglucosamine--N-acetylmuramyl-(pentapeptide) pyrophosphoryl-undecaprenol N-acetylglucosamine transferase
VLGGGSGALALNSYVADHIGEITQDWYVLHSTGAGKEVTINSPHYAQVPFITDMATYLAAADAVLCRPGMGTLGELSASAKASVLVPMPGTHPEKHANPTTLYHPR